MGYTWPTTPPSPRQRTLSAPAAALKGMPPPLHSGSSPSLRKACVRSSLVLRLSPPLVLRLSPQLVLRLSPQLVLRLSPPLVLRLSPPQRAQVRRKWVEGGSESENQWAVVVVVCSPCHVLSGRCLPAAPLCLRGGVKSSLVPSTAHCRSLCHVVLFILHLFVCYPFRLYLFRLELGVLLGVAYRTGASRRHLPRLVCGWVGAYLGGAGWSLC